MSRVLFGFLLLCSGALAATPPDRAPQVLSLGRDLTYVRLVRLPADLPASSAAAARGSAIVDLRGTQSDDRGAQAIETWIHVHAKPSAPVFLLVNKATSPSLLDMIQTLRDSNLPLVCFGPASLGNAVDVAVNTTDQEDRLACEAIAKGSPLATLAAPAVTKVRHDEAELDRDLREGIRPDDSDDSDSQDLTAPEPKPPLVDLVLARAIQLNHALIALGRLPIRTP